MIKPKNKLTVVQGDHSRLSWATHDLMALWKPRLAKLKQAIWVTDRHLAFTGIKPSSYTRVGTRDIDFLSAKFSFHGLDTAIVHERIGQRFVVSPSYLTEESLQFRYWMLAAPRGLLGILEGALVQGDHATIAQIMDHPPCCGRFQKWLDQSQEKQHPTWAVARRTQHQVALSSDHIELRNISNVAPLFSGSGSTFLITFHAVILANPRRKLPGVSSKQVGIWDSMRRWIGSKRS